jgi:ArsR family metal-binding transcriptional regulator
VQLLEIQYNLVSAMQLLERVQPGVSYAQIVNQRTIQHVRNNAMQPEPLISLTTSRDMTELKHMLKTLVEQMSTMLNLLTVITKLAK